MSSMGWIKLHRKINECWIWEEKPFDKARAWIDLLLLANHSDKKLLFNGNVISVKKGQYLTSIRKLAERWGWSYDKVSRFIKILVAEDMLQKESDSSRTLLTIVNYEVYQDVPNTDECTELTPSSEPSEHPKVNHPNTDRTQTSDKQELKNEKNINIRSNSDDLNESDKQKKKKTKLTEEENEEIVKNFEIIYNSYPRKVGKTAGFELYKQWLNGRDILGKRIKLTNRQMWIAIARYKKQIEDNETEKQFIKQFDTFMRKPILDYIGDEEQ